MTHEKPVITIYAIAHFTVDFSCAFLMFHSVLSTDRFYMAMFVYNFCAFALQMPVGLLADQWNKNCLCAIAGCLLVVSSYGLTAAPLLTAAAAGAGNCLFHVGGGIDILNLSGRRAAPLGVFIAPGALGIFLGTLLGRQAGASALLPILLPLLLGLLITIVMGRRCNGFHSGNQKISLNGAGRPAVLLPLTGLFLVVILRSYGGFVMDFQWKSQWHWAFAISCCTVLGKMAGGFAADRFGLQRTSLMSLLPAFVLFLFPHIPVLSVSAIFLFNMTMPVTLYAAARLLDKSKGFSFGMLTFALFLGFLPVYLRCPVPGFLQPEQLTAPSVICAVSLCLLLWSVSSLMRYDNARQS